MALESPLMVSPNLISAFSPFTDSPTSPRPPSRTSRVSGMASDVVQQSLHPFARPQQSPGLSPSAVEAPHPSPITSTGTVSTEIDDSEDDVDQTSQKSPDLPTSVSGESVASHATAINDMDADQRQPVPTTNGFHPKAINTAIENRLRSNSDETPGSVIHAPLGFNEFKTSELNRSPPPNRHSTPSPSLRSDITVKSPPLAKTEFKAGEKTKSDSPVSPPPPIRTGLGSSRLPLDGMTPRAQTRQESEAMELDKARRRRSRSLEDIPEAQDLDAEDEFVHRSDPSSATTGLFPDSAEEIKALKAALGECWTLCNTLAGLSSIHRERIFNYAGTGDIQELAWKCCWKLCQKLYDSLDEDHGSHVRPTLDLCRDFCQALFEVRQRENEIADSVLRVSFELNNHLYNTHDRNLPEAFRERTLDFYITLCHRLMKQRSGVTEETDSLLRACWSLAEMLFSLRQNKREGKQADEELLGSAVQACWELCDLFREGWTQIRPDRGTPRPSQTTFTQTKQSNLPAVAEVRNHVEPETPTTIFEDTLGSPVEETHVPNILVLGTENPRGSQIWSSPAYSVYSQDSSNNTSSTATSTEDINMTRLKVLIVRAAMNVGFQRSQGQTLNSFVKTLSSNSFGTQAWQLKLLENYKKMVLSDLQFRAPSNLPPRRATAAEVAKAVHWMVSSGQYPFLRDLFRLVCGFHTDEASMRKGVIIQT